jgi:hypothetical protein
MCSRVGPDWLCLPRAPSPSLLPLAPMCSRVGPDCHKRTGPCLPHSRGPRAVHGTLLSHGRCGVLSARAPQHTVPQKSAPAAHQPLGADDLLAGPKVVAARGADDLLAGPEVVAAGVAPLRLAEDDLDVADLLVAADAVPVHDLESQLGHAAAAPCRSRDT